MPRRLNADAAAAVAAELGDLTRHRTAGMSDVDRRSLTQLHLAVVELLNAVNGALREEFDKARECVQRTSAILQDESLAQYSEGRSAPRKVKSTTRILGGLAPWRIRQVTQYIETHLDSTITTKDLAALVKLSSFHFCRAFRQSFDDSPHVFLMRCRVERAQRLMLTTGSSLGQIAAECGLADQAHFNKLFRRFVGDSPGAWRRARMVAPLQN